MAASPHIRTLAKPFSKSDFSLDIKKQSISHQFQEKYTLKKVDSYKEESAKNPFFSEALQMMEENEKTEEIFIEIMMNLLKTQKQLIKKVFFISFDLSLNEFITS